ncbi:hypothetical protein KUTeg_023347 [Tegillarca granosa]|uniref:Glutathione S-transferase n=1 Tax=Tegillarca granosa TaxID=220873 RepID=A0ABQ9E1Z3_TEGGR|nr:hypothetical protein KUTeg_023347 [Tegillarca granosa]
MDKFVDRHGKNSVCNELIKFCKSPSDEQRIAILLWEMEKLQLYCSWFCPFAQRAWIALEHKGVEYEYIEVDPYNKTKEFLAINPRGLVPVLVKDNRTVYESSICIEFIDEALTTGVSLLPKDPMDRAQVRIWSDFISKRIVPTFYQILQMQEKDKQEEAKDKLLQHLLTLTKAMSSEGPYFSGKALGMVDIMLIPFAIRFNILSNGQVEVVLFVVLSVCLESMDCTGTQRRRTHIIKQEFLAINPRSLIPVLVQDNRTVYESPICIEYIDEAFQTGVSLLPKDPMDRAQVQIWSDFISKRIVPSYYQMLQMQRKEQQNEAKERLLQQLLTLSKAMSPDGPYFTGEAFGMVDIMLILIL